MATGDGAAIRLETILAATDFSDTAQLAVEHAAALAKRQGARLVLVHGHTMGVYWIGPAKPLTIPSSYEESVLRDTREQIDALAARLRETGIEVDTQLVSASGTEAVLYVAKETDADLIVTGTRGHTGFKHLLLGSTAEEIVRTARRPVLSIHPGDDPPDGGKLHIVLPTDFSGYATLALQEAVALFTGDPANCSLLLVHVLHTPALLAPMVGDIAMRQVFIDQAREKTVEGLDELAQQFRDGGYEVETAVLEGDPADAIAEIARERGADLIAMGTRGLTGLKRIVQGSVADRTVRHAECPVLTVPREPAGD
jgi:nucleotide-binding universal stress UspA family protein